MLFPGSTVTSNNAAAVKSASVVKDEKRSPVLGSRMCCSSVSELNWPTNAYEPWTYAHRA